MSRHSISEYLIAYTPAAAGMVGGMYKGFLEAKGASVPSGTLDAIITYAPTAVSAAVFAAPVALLSAFNSLLSLGGMEMRPSHIAKAAGFGAAIGAGATALGYGLGYVAGKI